MLEILGRRVVAAELTDEIIALPLPLMLTVDDDEAAACWPLEELLADAALPELEATGSAKEILLLIRSAAVESSWIGAVLTIGRVMDALVFATVLVATATRTTAHRLGRTIAIGVVIIII